MRHFLWATLLLMIPFVGATAEVDPNYYIYLCFGQSNMEGNAKAESIDAQVDSRFKMLATCKFDNPARALGHWYVAKVPIVNPAGNLGPTDYFGRTLVAALPKNVKVGVVAVAMGGSPIEMFDKDKYAKKLADNPNEWWAILAKQHYGGNPYQRLIDMARKAQEVGVIKGILLHQGCSNNGDPNWPNMVKKIYKDILADLQLEAADVPLFVGETLRQEEGGACWGHNSVVAKMPKTVPTAYVISSEGCPGNGQDPWHFSAMGYRILGKRYAFQALKVMGQPTLQNEDYRLPNNLKRLFTATELKTDIEGELTLKKGRSKRVKVTATFLDGHTEDVTDSVHLSGPDFLTLSGNQIKVVEEGSGTVTVSYTDFTRATVTTEIAITSGPGAGIGELPSPSATQSSHSSAPAPQSSHSSAPAIYDVRGRRVTRLGHGLYIINGKKVIR